MLCLRHALSLRFLPSIPVQNRTCPASSAQRAIHGQPLRLSLRPCSPSWDCKSPFQPRHPSRRHLNLLLRRYAALWAPRAVLNMSEPSLLRDNRSTCNRRRGPSRLVTSFHGPQAEFAPGVEPSVGCSMPPSDHLHPRRRSRTTPPCMATRTDRPSLRRTLRR